MPAERGGVSLHGEKLAVYRDIFFLNVVYSSLNRERTRQTCKDSQTDSQAETEIYRDRERQTDTRADKDTEAETDRKIT